MYCSVERRLSNILKKLNIFILFIIGFKTRNKRSVNKVKGPEYFSKWLHNFKLENAMQKEQNYPNIQERYTPTT